MGYTTNRVFLTLATVLGFSLIMGLAVLVIVVRTADVSPTPTQAVIIVAAPTDAQTATPTPTITPTPSAALPTATLTPEITEVACAFAWAHVDLPTTTSTTQAALDAAGIMHATVRAEAYGENCLEANGNVRYFAAMTTDFYFTIEVEADDLYDDQMLAAFIKPLYNIAAAVPREQIPAPPGYFDLTFTSSQGAVRLRTRFDDAQAALQRDLKGVALLDALGGVDSISG